MPDCSRRMFLAACLLAVAWLTGQPASAASPAWTDRRSYGPFDCAAAFPLASLEPFFEELPRLQQELQRTLGVPPASRRIEIFLFAEEASHREYLHGLYPNVPYRRALFVERGGQGAVYAYRQADLTVDLRHECTHALLHASLPMVPLWLDEGLAEYFEVPEPARAFDNPHLAALRWNLRLGMQKSVESLEAVPDLSGMGEVEYRFSWAWVHFMLHGPAPAHRALVQYLAAIRRGEVPGDLSHRLRAAVPQLDQRMAQHFEHWYK